MDTVTTSPAPRMLTRHEVADRLGISLRQVDYFVKSGQLRPTRLGRLIKFKPAIVNEFIDAMTDAPAESSAS